VRPEFLARLDDLIAQLGQPLVVQEFVAGREAETPVFVDGLPIALPSVGISIDGQRKLGDDFLVYEKVAVDNFGFYRLEEDDPELVARLGQAAMSAARTLQLEGFCRVDARIGDNGDIRITDVSTTPHLVAHSSFAFRFKDYAEDASIYASLAGLALKAQLSVQN
jgi:D-alanine-D-alanine ligase